MARKNDNAEIPLSLIGKYPSHWEASTLAKACSLVTDGTHDSPKESQTGFPLVTGRCITGGRINLKEAYLISEDDHKEVIARSKPQFGDILFANIGNSIGELARVETDAEFSIKNVALFKPSPRVESQYLKYYLLSPVVQAYIRGNTFGSAQPFVGLGTLRAFPIPLPPLAEQKIIAQILGTLDDKIEMNRQLNATLEAMAMALFQSWFVDFDPVRANLDGHKLAGLDAATAELFPAHFQDSHIGHIPQGWSASNFGKVIAAARGRVGEAEAVVLSAVSSSELVRSDEHFTKQVYSKSISNYLKVRRWDFAYNPSRINIGSVGMLKEDIVGAVSPVYEVFRPADEYHWFVERALAQPDVRIWIQSLCSGSVRQSLKLKNLESIPCVIPPLQIVQAFNRIWESWHGLIHANEEQSRTLATLRDALLPKLLSGDISVANIEDEVACV